MADITALEQALAGKRAVLKHAKFVHGSESFGPTAKRVISKAKTAAEMAEKRLDQARRKNTSSSKRGVNQK